VGKLGVGPIGVEKGWRGVLHGEQEATANGGQRARCGVDWPVPATVIAGGEGGGAGKHQKVLAHLWTLGIGSEWALAAARRE
jgi:hypothetical protein